MVGPAAWYNGDDVEAPVAACEIRPPRHPNLCGAANAPLRCWRHGFQCRYQIFSRFDFDKGNELTSSGDQINFAGRRPRSMVEDAIAF